ncbi:MAG: DUF1848 domain-containing protein [Candidatus Bipolaricaulota bacterium]|nr:DUF1848 domain-containing protein [Candidatus Bipolaricaulota bacterium]
MGSSPTPGTRVVSASRRTDLPRHFLPWLVRALARGEAAVRLPYGGIRQVSLRPEEVHTLVLWSKDFSQLLSHPALLRLLRRYDQLFFHFTVTGLGGTELEPGVPPPEEALGQLPGLVALAGRPERVVLRFDPIVHWWEEGRLRSNLPWAEAVFRAARRVGARDVRTSFATLYGKVLRRGVRWWEPPAKEKHRIARELKDLAEVYGVELGACADPVLEEAGIPRVPCIDGRRLTALHPAGEPASLRRDRGQRPECLCTESADIGSYTRACPGGCRYCYARPVVTELRPGRPGRRTLPRGSTGAPRPSARASSGSGSGGARTRERPRGGGGGGPS